MIAGLIGVPFGVFSLMVSDTYTMKLFVGITTTLFAISFLLGFKKVIQNEKVAFVPVGFISGLLIGSTSMGGPPVILFFSNQGVEKQAFRANLIAYFGVLSLLAVPTLILGGLMNVEVVNYAITFLPALLLGTITGMKSSKKANEGLFRKITLLIVTVTGLISIFSCLVK
jgi:uncharacterized membrane protein YfcA